MPEAKIAATVRQPAESSLHERSSPPVSVVRIGLPVRSCAVYPLHPPTIHPSTIPSQSSQRTSTTRAPTCYATVSRHPPSWEWEPLAATGLVGRTDDCQSPTTGVAESMGARAGAQSPRGLGCASNHAPNSSGPPENGPIGGRSDTLRPQSELDGSTACGGLVAPHLSAATQLPD